MRVVQRDVARDRLAAEGDLRLEVLLVLVRDVVARPLLGQLVVDLRWVEGLGSGIGLGLGGRVRVRGRGGSWWWTSTSLRQKVLARP